MALDPITDGFSPIPDTFHTHEERYISEDITYSNIHGVGSLIQGRTYKIVSLEGTDFTTVGSPSNEIGQTFIATGSGEFYATDIRPNYYYKIKSLGNTDFTLIGAASNTIGLMFKATAVGTGTGSVTSGNGAARTYYQVTVTADRPIPSISTNNSNIFGKYISVFTDSSESYRTTNQTLVTVDTWQKVDEAIANNTLADIYKFSADRQTDSLFNYTATASIGPPYTADTSIKADTSIRVNKLRSVYLEKQYVVDVENRYTMGKYELMVRLGKKVGTDWINNTNKTIKWNNNGEPVVWLSDI